jgi:RNA polymerase sigma-70 factor (ECF subfamily)
VPDHDLPDHDEFVLNLINLQGRLSAYIYSLVLDQETTHDILQRTNLVLLEKRSEFEPATSFAAWAFRIAYYEILASRRDRQRERLLFDDEVLAALAVAGETAAMQANDRLDALLECLASLPEGQRKLVLQRYQSGGSVQHLATQMKRTPAAISNLLYRVRTQLLNCVRRRMDDTPQ